MDRPVRKFVLWKCRNIPKLQERLDNYRRMRDDIIDESSSGIDGQPKAKYTFNDAVSNKVVRRENLDFSIKKLEYEINTIENFYASLRGYEKEVYDETILKESNITAKADFFGIGKNKLVEDRAQLLRQVAYLIGEYIDEN